MNRKLFKKLLIATSMIAPVAIVTPMILSSCNDNTNNSPGSSGSNTIALGTLSNLLKDKIINGEQSFWLDVVDYHGNSFAQNEDKDNQNQVRPFYQQLVNDRESLIKKLMNDQKFLYNNTSTLPTDFYANDIKLTKSTYVTSKENKTEFDKEVKNLNSIFNGLHLSNVSNNDGNQDDVGQHTGIIIDGSKIKFDDILDKLDVSSTIEIKNGKANLSGDNANLPSKEKLDLIREANKYTIQYRLKPKTGFKWAGVDSTKDKYPLYITLVDYVDNVSIVNNLNEIQLENISTSPDVKGYKFVGSKTSEASTDEASMKKEIATGLGVNEADLAENKQLTTESTTKEDAMKIVKFINGFKPTTRAFSELQINNTIDSIINQRISLSINKFASSADKIDISIKIDLSKLSYGNTQNALPDFEWFLNWDAITIDNKNMSSMLYELTLNKKV